MILTTKEYLDLFSGDIQINCLKYVEGMNKHNAEKYLLELAANSLEIKPTASITCDCGKELRYEIEKLYLSESDDELFYDLGEIKIQFKYPNINLPEDGVEQFLSCIDFIVIGDDIIKWDDIDNNQLEYCSEFFTFDFIQEVLNKLNVKIYTTLHFDCECGYTHDEVVQGFEDLMEFYKI